MQPVTSVNINNYQTLQPLLAALKTQNDQLPKNTLPIDSMGTIQENVHNIPTVTLYNAHGILNNKNPNALIGYA